MIRTRISRLEATAILLRHGHFITGSRQCGKRRCHDKIIEMVVRVLHDGLANTALMYALLLALWSFWLYVRRSELTSQFWGALAIAALIFVVQAAIGVIMVLQGRFPWRDVHYLYGVLGVITLPAAFAFMRGRGGFREALLYGVILLFLAGVALRARMTAG